MFMFLTQNSCSLDQLISDHEYLVDENMLCYYFNPSDHDLIRLALPLPLLIRREGLIART